jgi:hypothetical protein
MPDGDKFYWGIRGTGSRTFLNLARNASSSLDSVADQGARVVTNQLKRPLVQRVLRESLQLLELALPRLEADCLATIPDSAVFHEQLRHLREEAAGDDFAAVVLRKVESVHERLHASGQSLPRTDLKRELGESCARGILGYAALDPTRSALMKETGRSFAEQRAFEHGLTMGVADRMRSVVDRICDSNSTESIRSPRRRSPREDFTMERLRAPLGR